MAMTATQIDELYRRHAPALRKMVRLGVHTDEAVIEDACQSAWMALLHHRERVGHDRALPWLVSTAAREALHLLGRQARVTALEDVPETARASTLPDPYEALVLRERLTALHGLPRRQQRLLWLHAAGHSYGEMAGCECISRRTVERQLLRGRRAARALAASA